MSHPIQHTREILSSPATFVCTSEYIEEHPCYRLVSSMFDAEFKEAVGESVPEDTYEEDEFSSDFLCAIDEILYELFGFGDCAHYKYPESLNPPHSYGESLKIAQEKTLSLLRPAFESARNQMLVKPSEYFSILLPQKPSHSSNLHVDETNSSGNEDSISSPAKQFLPPPEDLTSLTHEMLVNRIINITCEYRKTKNYNSVRDEFMAVSLELNNRALLAPLWRDQPLIPRLEKDRNSSHDQLLIDQLVIDCHWLWSRKENVSPRWAQLKRFFTNTVSFDCDAIAEIIGPKCWSTDFRATELFSVPTRLQFQLVQLRSNTLKDKYRSYIHGEHEYDFETRKSNRKKAKISSIRLMINDWADGNHRIQGHEDMYESLWLGREFLNNEASLSDIAEFAALRLGVQQLDRKTVQGKLQNLDQALVNSGLPSGKTVGV